MAKKHEDDAPKWLAVIVDGHFCGLLKPGQMAEKEVKRLQGLSGIFIRPASQEELAMRKTKENTNG